jgi:membrane protease YdiL (CAAX protease family)
MQVPNSPLPPPKPASGNSATGKSPSTPFLAAAWFELSLGFIAILLGAVIGINPREHLPRGWPLAQFDWLWIARSIAIAVPFAFLLLVLVQLIGRLPLDPLNRLEQITKNQLRSTLGPSTIPQLIILSLAAGVGEELLFRGLIQNAFLSLYSPTTLAGALPAIICASIAFGFAHPISKSYILVTTLIGLLFGFVYWHYKDLLACVLAHSLYDAALLITWKWSEFK